MKFHGYEPADRTGMQLAPMIDIVFLLLIFFLVTWSFAIFENEIGISVPAASEGQTPQRAIGEIIVNVRKDGQILLEGAERNEEELEGRLQQISAVYKNQAVIVRGDAETNYGEIVRILNVCQRAGIWNVAFATKRDE